MIDVGTDAFWFRGVTGITRFAHETSARFEHVYLRNKMSGTEGGFGFVVAPMRLRIASSRAPEVRVFWSPGFIPIWRSAIPQCVTVHDLNHVLCYSRWHKVAAEHWLLPLLRCVEKIVTVSQHTKTLMVDKYGFREERIVVAYNGISASFVPGIYPNPTERYVLYVGNRRPYKNVPRLVAAFALVAEKCDADLVLTGSFDHRLDALFRERVKGRRIRFIGAPDESTLSRLYGAALCCVLVSQFEGFGLPPVEALACGTPVVVSNCSSMPEVCGDYARYVDPTDLSDIAEGIRDVVMHNARWRDVASSAAGFVRRYNWDTTARIVEASILDAAEARR